MRTSHLFYLILMLLVNIQVSAKERSSYQVDFKDPVKVVQAIFDAAKNKDTSYLSSLCHPGGKGDGDVKDVCQMHPKHKKWASFYTHFVTGQIVGEAKILNNRAKVKFLFGPDGTHKEEMNLILYNNKWYLSSF